MEIDGYSVPEDLLYTKEHEWARPAGAVVQVGVTDYAAKTLNDVVYATLPKVGGRVEQSKSMGTVESIKAVSELYSPVTGAVARVNEALQSHPELVNKSPYGEGWLIEVKADDFEADRKGLLGPQAYADHVAAQAHK